MQLEMNADPSHKLFLTSVPQGNLIFINDAGNHTTLSPKELCAIESAARNNPNSTIIYALQLRSMMPLAFNQPILEVAATYKNLKFQHTALETLSSGTPIEKWLKNSTLTGNMNNNSHANIVSGATDLAKFLQLYKYGGSVVDTDVIVLKSLERFSNAVGYYDDFLNNNVMTFSKMHKVVHLALDIFTKRYAKPLSSKLSTKRWFFIKNIF
jgi:lactosylceramide 4-alpha-galactosyltransferase